MSRALDELEITTLVLKNFPLLGHRCRPSSSAMAGFVLVFHTANRTTFTPFVMGFSCILFAPPFCCLISYQGPSGRRCDSHHRPLIELRTLRIRGLHTSRQTPA